MYSRRRTTAGARRRGLVRAGRAGRRVLALVAAGAIVAGCGGSGGDGGPTASSPTAGGKAASSTPAGAQAITVVGRQRLSARLEDWTLRTPALREPTRVRVLLPAGYDADPGRRYPVLYLLHGASSDYRSWTRYGDAEAITARARMIVVMPDGGAMGWYTDWYQGARPVQPRWETCTPADLDRRAAAVARARRAAHRRRKARPARPPRHEAGLPGLRARALPTPQQRATACAAEGARHPSPLGRLRAGTHDWPYWRRDLRETLPDLLRVLARA